MHSVEMSDEQMELMKKVASHVESIIKLMEIYEGCRAGSMVFTKLEEAMMWFNNLMATGKLESKKFTTTTQ